MKKKLTYTLILVLWFVAIFHSNSIATKYHIDVQDFSFSPSTIPTVKIGDTIEWEWKSGSHTTTSITVPAGAATWDQPINSNSIFFEYIPAVIGTYAYKCTPHFAMGMTGTFTVIPLGISEVPPYVQIHVYPNAFVDNLHIRVQSDDSFIRTLVIFDLSGRVLGGLSFTSSPGISDVTFNLSDYPRGELILQFLDNHNRKYIEKVFKL